LPYNIVDLTAVVGLFVVLPTLLVGGWLGSRWLKLKTAELELRRSELELEKKKVEYLTSETNREAADRLAKS